MTGVRRAVTVGGALGVAWLATALGACAHAPRLAPPTGGPAITLTRPPAIDSATVGLWRLDEAAGTTLNDSGPRRLDGAIGRDTRPEFARFSGGRRFGRSLNSFGYVAYAAGLETGVEFSVEAWIQPTAYSLFESSAIVARWAREANQQSWFLGLAGERTGTARLGRVSPGTLADLTGSAGIGVLVFGLLPSAAGEERAFTSTGVIPRDRWTHVAATFDGSVVRLFVDGRLDAQYAFSGRIRASAAPLLIGNLLDSAWFVEYSGSIRLEPTVDAYPYYAFEGLIDEVRLSDVARSAPSQGR